MHVTTNTFLWVKKLFCCIFFLFNLSIRNLENWSSRWGSLICGGPLTPWPTAFKWKSSSNRRFFFLPPRHRLTWEVWSDQPDSASSKGLGCAFYSRTGTSVGWTESQARLCRSPPLISVFLSLSFLSSLTRTNVCRKLSLPYIETSNIFSWAEMFWLRGVKTSQ